MRIIRRRKRCVFLPVCVLVSLVAACEKGAVVSDRSGTPPSAVASVVQPVAPVKAEITPEEAKALLDANDGYTYLDVRTVEEFTDGHVPGALNIPILVISESGEHAPNAEFLATTQAVFPKDAKIIVGCRSGARSKRAQDVMNTFGYVHLSNMLGGFVGSGSESGWSALGYPVEAGDGGEKSYASLRAKATP